MHTAKINILRPAAKIAELFLTDNEKDKIYGGNWGASAKRRCLEGISEIFKFLDFSIERCH